MEFLLAIQVFIDDFFKAYPFKDIVNPNYREDMINKEISRMSD